MDTRRKSRSKTPFLRSNCDNDGCTHDGEDGHVHIRKKSPYVKKHPQVRAIIEESNEIQKKQQQHLIVENTHQKSSAITTSDYSSNSSEDLSTEQAIAGIPCSSGISAGRNKISTTTTKTTTTMTQKTNNTSDNNWNVNDGQISIAGTSRQQQSRQFSTPIHGRQITKEISENEINAEFENSKIKSSTPIFGSQQINKNSKLDISPAYLEYKEAGEYWAKYPKTDYTYSKLSPHRREVAPGVVCMPNMSRKSLENHHERITYMIDRNPEQESYIRSRFDMKQQHNNNKSKEQINAVNHLLYDSQDEVDLLFEYNNSNTTTEVTSNHNMYTEETWITKTISFSVLMFQRFCSMFTYNTQNNLYTHRIKQERRDTFGNIKNGFTKLILSIFSYFYLLISSVLYLDTLFLKSSTADNMNKKRFLLLMLILLPLILLAAWNLMEDHERNKLLLKTQNLIPISLIGFRNIFPSDWKTIFNQNFWPLGVEKIQSSSSNHINYDSITNNIQKSLSPDEYNNIINNVNIYVKKLIDDKLEKEHLDNIRINNQLSNDLKILIANTVRENILALIPPNLDRNHGKYELTDSDLQLIVIEVEKKLSKNNYLSGSISFNQDNIEELSKLIKSQININDKNLNIMEYVDIHEILFRIFDSPELNGIIDSRIKFHENNEGLLITKNNDNNIINKQQLIINELNNEIEFIKRILAENLNKNENLYQSIDMLKIDYNEFLTRFNNHEFKINSRFDNLLAEIDSKISNLNDQQFTLINKQIKLSLIEILGYNKNDNINIDEIDLKNWIRNMFVAKEFLENKLNELNLQFDNKLKNEIDNSGMIIMKDINEKLKLEILKAVELKHKDLNLGLNIKTELAEEDIKKIVRKILTVYDADKTGLVDYALESAGGQILSTRCTENYHTRSAQLSVFGIPLWYPSNTPRIAISPAVHPGECWAFQAFPGYLVLKLNSVVFVSGFTLEHIPKSLAPNGKIDSAPRNFTVWGLDKENDEEPIQFGDYEYTDTSPALQYFPVQNNNIKRPFDIVELRIETNHGNPQYTCLYRFRVHGKPAT